MTMNIFTRVDAILRENVSARDSDAILMYYYLKDLGHNPETITASRLLHMMHQGEISFESLSRVRRKVQSESPEVRGAKYEERQNATKTWQKSLGYPV